MTMLSLWGVDSKVNQNFVVQNLQIVPRMIAPLEKFFDLIFAKSKEWMNDLWELFSTADTRSSGVSK